jgi:transcriptional regulator with XRE-family HTH domain
MSKLIKYLEDQTQPKISAKELAARIGISASLLSYWMSGHRKPGKSKLQKVSKITGIKIEDLL